uniref:Uncharacterized protein n=1 Tax=Oryza brachyantha TaxID=4533 RepID=J3MH55_ORYBR
MALAPTSVRSFIAGRPLCTGGSSTAPVLPRRPARRPSARLSCRAADEKSTRPGDLEVKLGKLAMVAVAAGVLALSPVVDDAMAAKSGGRIGGQAFRSAPRSAPRPSGPRINNSRTNIYINPPAAGGPATGRRVRLRLRLRWLGLVAVLLLRPRPDRRRRCRRRLRHARAVHRVRSDRRRRQAVSQQGQRRFRRLLKHNELITVLLILLGTGYHQTKPCVIIARLFFFFVKSKGTDGLEAKYSTLICARGATCLYNFVLVNVSRFLLEL